MAVIHLVHINNDRLVLPDPGLPSLLIVVIVPVSDVDCVFDVDCVLGGWVVVGAFSKKANKQVL